MRTRWVGVRGGSIVTFCISVCNWPVTCVLSWTEFCVHIAFDVHKWPRFLFGDGSKFQHSRSRHPCGLLVSSSYFTTTCPFVLLHLFLWLLFFDTFVDVLIDLVFRPNDMRFTNWTCYFHTKQFDTFLSPFEVTSSWYTVFTWFRSLDFLCSILWRSKSSFEVRLASAPIQASVRARRLVVWLAFDVRGHYNFVTLSILYCSFKFVVE